MVRPLPPQVGQVRSIRKKPCCARTLPAPWQVLQVVAAAAPLSDPVPLHASQDTEEGTVMVFFVPLKASSSPISTLVRRSAPRPEPGAAAVRLPPPKRPNISSKMSSKPPKGPPAPPAPGRRPAAAVEGGVAEAVVGGALLAVLQDVVGLVASLKRPSASLFPWLRSGWNCIASLRYAFLMSSSEASRWTPRMS
jgi:hypothetical protein